MYQQDPRSSGSRIYWWEISGLQRRGISKRGRIKFINDRVNENRKRSYCGKFDDRPKGRNHKVVYHEISYVRLADSWIREERISLPVGTTVRINGFLNPIPVRRQTALKTATKSLIKIKKLLQAYALARPSVRFTLKVLKAKNDTGNWIYAPKYGEYILEAARRIIGRDVVDQCQWKVYEPSHTDADEKLAAHGDPVQAEGSYKIEALLPKSKYGKLPSYVMLRHIRYLDSSDSQVISNIGQFVSVDSRPVSCGRGTFKKIIGLYKSYLGSGTLIESSNKPKDPFLCMQISCPPASYDVNVEPAKDDVLFTNVAFVLAMLEKFFKDIYGDVNTKPLQNAALLPSHAKPRGFEVFLARKREPPASAPNKTSPPLDSTSGERAHISSRSPVTVLKQALTTSEGYFKAKSGENALLSGVTAMNRRSNRLHAENRHFGGNVGTVEEYSPANEGQIRQPSAYVDVADMPSSPICANRRTNCAHNWDGDEASRVPNVSNPWTFAKLNTPIRQPDACQRVNNQLLTPGYQTGELDEIIGRPVHGVKTGTKPNRHGLPTPQRTQAGQNFSATFRSCSPEPHPFLSNDSRAGPKNTRLSTDFPTNHPNYGFGTLDSWIQRSPDDDPAILHSSSLDSFDHTGQGILLPEARDFVSARTMVMGNHLTGFPQVDEQLSLRSPPPERSASEEPTLQLSLPDNDRCDDSVGRESRGRLKQCPPIVRCDRDSASVAASVSAEDRECEGTSQLDLLSNTPSVHPDLAKALDYEVRKQAAIKQWRVNQSSRLVKNDISQTPNSSVPSPHQNRHRRALATLRHPTDDDAEASPEPALKYNDPRAYLIRTREQGKSDGFSLGARKRRKTSSLPLETVHEQSTVRDLTSNIDTKNMNLSKSARKCALSGEPCDTYLTSGTISPGFSSKQLTTDIVRTWEERVRELLKSLYKTDRNMNELGRITAAINLWPLMQTHLAIYP